MNFFDSLIENVNSVTSNLTRSSFGYNKDNSWEDTGHSQVILQRDTAFELNGTGFCLVTSKDKDFNTVVIGKDLNEIKKDTSFARIAVVSVGDCSDDQSAYDLIKKIEYVKYHFFPEGYMLRSSTTSFKESVRVSKKALKSGISFEKIGNLMLRKFREIPEVCGATVYFITDDSVNYSLIKEFAEKSRKVTEALNQVMNNVEFNCSSCNLKPICDEVEGMRELHFKKSGKGMK